MTHISVSQLTKGAHVVLKGCAYRVSADPINTGNSSIVVLDGLGVRDWANDKRVWIAG